MSSRFICKCGERVDKNFFSGNCVALLIAEENVDRNFSGVSAEDFIHGLIQRSLTVVTCCSCLRLYVFDESGNVPVRVYVPEAQGSTDTDGQK